LRATLALQAQELGLQAAALLFNGRPRRFDEKGLEPAITAAQARRSALSRALVLARAEATPGQQMSCVGVTAHINADLGNDSFCGEIAYAGGGGD
jgi:hypothetical protein